jgi:hypothetical protein
VLAVVVTPAGARRVAVGRGERARQRTWRAAHGHIRERRARLGIWRERATTALASRAI